MIAAIEKTPSQAKSKKATLMMKSRGGMMTNVDVESGRPTIPDDDDDDGILVPLEEIAGPLPPKERRIN